MGMAILPGRLLKELDLIKDCLQNNLDHKQYKELEKHGPWIEELKQRELPEDNLDEYLRQEVGKIFEQVIEDCNVFKYGTKEDLYRFVEKAMY